MKRALALILLILFGLLAITLEVKNPDNVQVLYYFGIDYTVPLALLLLIPFLVGLCLGALFMSLSVFKQKRALGKTKKELSKVEQEVKNLRSMPIKDEV